MVLRRRAPGGPIQAGALDPTTPEGMQKALPPFVVNLALSESIGIQGLVLALMSGRPAACLPFVAGELVLLYIHRPTASDLQPPAATGVGHRPRPIG